MADSTNAQQRPLLKLRAELKNMIYKLVLSKDIGPYCIPDSYERQRCYDLYQPNPKPKRGRGPKPSNTLKLVCLELCQDTKGLGLFCNNLVFPDLDHPEYACTSCSTFRPSMKENPWACCL